MTQDSAAGAVLDPDARPAVTSRFSRKRQAIIAAAIGVINEKGVKGMTLAEVADKVGLITTSVTYYFRRKETLAAACFLDGLVRMEALVARAAGQGASPSDRIRALLEGYLEDRRLALAGRGPLMPVFSDIRTLGEDVGGPVFDAYAQLFRAVRDLLSGTGGAPHDRRTATVRAHILLEQLHWIGGWAYRYGPQDDGRIAGQMHDILVNGLAAADSPWAPRRLPDPTLTPATRARASFLQAATRLINRYGYRGASVERISSALNVTKGSFYHYHSAKDGLVVDCFERSFEVVRQIQSAADGQPGGWARLSSAVAAIVERQLSEQGPLLRFSALAALPATIRDCMVVEAGGVAERFAAMIRDGVQDGSVRPVDPEIAAQMVLGAVNAAADLEALLQGQVGPADAAALYARPTLAGLLIP